MSTAVTPLPPNHLDAAGAAVLERVVLQGDLAQLSPADRIRYYRDVCQSLGLNPLTQPFLYIRLNGQLRLYPTADCAEQLRKLHAVSVRVQSAGTEGDLFIVRVEASSAGGRTDSDLAAVPIGGLKGEQLANAMMKTVTKAKRRVTLSICGLAWPDEGEMQTVPGTQRVRVDPATGEITEPAPAPPLAGGSDPLAALTTRLSASTERPRPAEPEAPEEEEDEADERDDEKHDEETRARPPQEPQRPSELELPMQRSIVLAQRNKLNLPEPVWMRYVREFTGVRSFQDATLDGLIALEGALKKLQQERAR